MTKGANIPMDRSRLERAIEEAMARDRRRLQARLRRLAGADEAGYRRLAAAIDRSRGVRAARRARLPVPEFPADLPITAERHAIAGALERHPVVVVCGETGSGKTTQLPKICLAAGRGAAGWIGHTQPRRIAARSVAARIARELGGRVGGMVGCKVRFHGDVGPHSFVKVMTDGILVAEISRDRRLEAYDTLIVDEAHERSLNIDLLLGHLKGLLAHRPELRVIVSSATLDTARLSDFFGGAPVIDVSGTTYPVEVRHADEAAAPDDPVAAVPEAVQGVVREGPGDVLVFLPGERDIREAARALRADHAYEVLPLYARLNHAQQDRVFRPGERRRVILATNVAETSVTVPGIRFVVDTGLARISRYSHRTKVQRLPVEPVSRASADQRRGRCGRVGPGVCVRLFSREDLEARPRFTAPEIRRTNLASVILRMAASGLPRVDEFDFIDPPDRRFVSDGYRLLRELGAFDVEDRVTPVGRRLARLPVDPRLGRMILAAEEFECVSEILVIAAALSAGDPRESRPEGEGRGSTVAAHRRFTDPRSDFMGFLNLWQLLTGESRRFRSAAWRRRCGELFVSARRAREWMDVYRQLLVSAREIGLRPASRPATYAQIHRAVLAGSIGHVGVRTKGREYRAPRDRTFVLSRASAVKPAGVHWIVAADLVETSAVYAHVAARIRPQWIERAARDFVTREHFEPQFDTERGEVMALERVVLHGLTVVPRRRVRFAPVDRAAARAILIAEGLAGGRMETGAPFERHNRALVEELRELERRARRRDLLAGDESRANFFDARIPMDVTSERGFRRWHESLADSDRLYYSIGDLVRPGARLPGARDFPDEIEVAGIPVELAYRFAPGEADDGVTARISPTVLGLLDPGPFEWLVPGHVEEKAIGLLRTLPRPVRRRIAPLRDTARRCLARAGLARAGLAGGGLAAFLVAALREVGGVDAGCADMRPGELPPHLHMRFEVVGTTGEVLGRGRDLEALKARFRGHAAQSFARAAAQSFEREGLTSWCFGVLPDHVDAVDDGVRFRGYPALEDRGRSVALRLFPNPRQAAEAHPSGVLRLATLRLGRELRSVRRSLGRTDRLALRYFPAPASPWAGEGSNAGRSSPPDIADEILERAVVECCLEDAPAVRTPGEFERRISDGSPHLVPSALAARDLTDRILSAWEEARAVRERFETRTYPESMADVDEQLAFLVYRGFIAETALARLEEIPRYLEAVRKRLEKLGRNPARDLESTRIVRSLWRPMREEIDRDRRSGGAPDPVREQCRWMLEELRVSLFVQEMGTRHPVSVQRVERAWEERLSAPPGSVPGPAAPRLPRAPVPDADTGSSPADRARE